MKIPGFISVNNMKRLWHLLRNKYVITSVFLLTWLLFFDRYDFFTQYKAVKQLRELRNEKAYYQNEIQKNQEDLRNLQTNPAFLERFAREKYLMKKENEDVFIVVDKRRNSAENP